MKKPDIHKQKFVALDTLINIFFCLQPDLNWLKVEKVFINFTYF